MDAWRVIRDGPRSASFNMAADAYLFERAQDSSHTPVLRLYAWDKSSITIGFHQTLERAVDCRHLGETPVVRRITGGRALLHDNGELTYAIAGNYLHQAILGDTLAASYHIIAEAIIRFYRLLGWPAAMARRDDPVLLSGSSGIQKGCFASVSRFEITACGQKLAASSQRRGGDALIQHGAIRIAPPARHPAIIDRPRTVAGEAFWSPTGPRGDLETAMIRACAETFGVALVEESFSEPELALIGELTRSYKNLSAGDDLIKQHPASNSPEYGGEGCQEGQKTS